MESTTTISTEPPTKEWSDDNLPAGIDRSHYHGWQGTLRPPRAACLALVGVALRQVFRRKLYWAVLALGLVHFLKFFVVIYVLTQVKVPVAIQAKLFENVGFGTTPAGGVETGYTMFMEKQSVVVMILLAFSGSLLVGADFRHKSLAFYLSRRIDRRHYIVGKLLAVSAIVSLLTVVPALVLFVEYGLFTNSFDYWFTHWRVPVAVLLYGAVLCLVLSTMLVTLSAYVQRVAPIAITWASLFLLLAKLSDMLRDATDDASWKLLDLWHNMHEVGQLLMGEIASGEQRELAYHSLAVLVIVCAMCLVALTRRVRAVDVVT